MPVAEVRRIWSADWIPILLGQAFAVGCGLVGVRLISALVAPTTLGDYGLFLALTPLGPLLSHAGFAKHAARHWGTSGDRRGYLHTLLRSSIPLTLLLAGAAFVAAGAVFLTTAAASAVLLIGWLWVANAAGGYALIFQNALQGARRFWADLIATIVSSVTRTFLPLLMVVATTASVGALAGGFALHAIVTAIAGFVLVRHLSRAPRPGRAAVESVDAQYHWSFAFAGTLTVLNNGANRWIGAQLFDPHTLGLFTLAMNLGHVVPNLVSAACGQFFFPHLVAAADRGDRGVFAKRFWTGLLLLLALSGGSAFAVAWVLPWLPGQLVDVRYAEALPFVLPLFGYGTALGIVFFCQHALLAAQAPREAGRIAFIGTLVLQVAAVSAALVSAEMFVAWLALSPLPVLTAVGFYANARARQALKR